MHVNQSALLLARSTRQIDPRYYQLAVQCGLLMWGLFGLQFMIQWQHATATLLTALLTQWAFMRYYAIQPQMLSALNTSLSIILLLHAGYWVWMALAAFIAIASKFLVRYRGRHVFNPSNIGIVVLLLVTDATWVTHGKWGQTMWLALLLAGLGLVWLLGWRRMLTSLTFLGLFSSLLVARAVWLGDPWSIPLHQLQNGALLVFTFFMLSDPMMTPQSITGRMLFGAWVAMLGWILQFVWFIPNAFLYALAFSSPFVILINLHFAGVLYQWPARSHT